MITPISDLRDWTVTEVGGGVVTVSSDGRSSAFSAAAGDGAQITKNIPLSANSKCTVKFAARVLSGEGNVWIHDKDTVINRQAIASNTWEWYEITASSKVFSSLDNSYFRINVGVSTTNAGEVEVADLSVSIDDGSLGGLVVAAAGSILLNSGVPSILSNVTGVRSAVILPDGFNLEVKVPELAVQVKTPLVYCNRIEGVGTETAGTWVPRFYDKAAGTIRFRFYEDGATSPKTLSTVNGAFAFRAETT